MTTYSRTFKFKNYKNNSLSDTITIIISSADQYLPIQIKIFHIQQNSKEKKPVMSNIKQINEHIFIDQARLLGKGSTGNVYFGGSSKNPNLKYAVKAIDLSEVTNQVTQYLLSCQIVALTELSKLNIQPIVKLHQIAFQQGYCYLAMELLQGGSLAEYIQENPNGLEEKQVQQLFRQMFQGYKTIKSQGIVHRDIKPDNIIFRSQKEPYRQGASKKLCFIDFGYCTKQSVPNRPKVYYNVGSPKYMSPQAYKKNTYSQKSDIWALGIILYEMLHGKTIDKDMDMDEYLHFMEHNQLPITRPINDLLRKLLYGMLTFEDSKRISCELIDQILNRNHQKVSLHIQPSQSRFPSMIPNLDIPPQDFNRRNSPFYRSQIITHRSEISETNVNPHIHHNQNISFDPRRKQRNFSQQNNLQVYNCSPKKITHIEHTSHKINGIQSNLPILTQKRNLIQNANNIQQVNAQHFFNRLTCPAKRQLEKIEQENDNEAHHLNLMKNQNILNFRRQPDIRRNFLRVIDQGKVQNSYSINPDHQRTNHSNVILVNNGNFSGSGGVPSKPNQMVRSQIFKFNQDQSFSTGNHFFSSQINDYHKPSIKVVTSDKTIKNHGLDLPQKELLNKNMNRSYSTQNVQRHNQNPHNISNPRFNPSRFHQHLPHGSLNPISEIPTDNHNQRPIDFLTQNKLLPNNRAFLRNTMPNVYKSTIQTSNHTHNRQFSQNHEQPINFRNQNTSLIEQTNQSNFKSHGPYFDQKFVTPQKQILSHNPHHTQVFKADTSLSVGGNKNEKSSSFKFITQLVPLSVQSEGIPLNVLNHTPSKDYQFNQQQISQFKQSSIAPGQVNQTGIQINQQPILTNIVNQPQHIFNQGNQPKQVFFNHQQPRGRINQNQLQSHYSQPHQQIITLQQPNRDRDVNIQFKKSVIMDHSPGIHQHNFIIPQQRASQNLSIQQTRQAVFVEKQFMSQPPQNQRPFLVNGMNQNMEINRMMRPTHPFGNPQPISVSQY